MQFDPQDQDIIRLLTKLKDTDEEYPEPMFVARRRSYLKQMTEIGLGISGGMEIRNPVKQVRVPRISPITSAVLETILIVVIVAEASAMAYVYRDQVSDFIQSLINPARTEKATPLPADPTSPEIQGVLPSVAVPSTLAPESATGITVTPSGTLVPGIVNNTPQVVPPNATPIPNEDNGNNGNHYGQTPKPERTKENKGNNDKPPKDDKPPKEEPKPTKDK
jgi:hypothetical protein